MNPVVDAMKRGAVLLLDEIDLASNKIMCLQPILEGKGVFLKKINEYVEPAKGFNIIATANTKGHNSEDLIDLLITNVLNETFLRDFRLLSKSIVSFDEDRNKHCTKGIPRP